MDGEDGFTVRPGPPEVITITMNSWKPPGMPVWLEGSPTEEERTREEANVAAARAVWKPSKSAWLLLEHLRRAIGKSVVIQQWDEMMLFDFDDQPPAFRARCRDVVVRTETNLSAAYLVLKQANDEDILFAVAELYEIVIHEDP